MHAADPPPHAGSTLVDAWPLFALRIRSEHLVLRLPTDDDLLALLDVAKAGIHPPDEMPFGVAWSAASSPEFERGFLAHHWQCRAEWSRDKWQLNLLVEAEGRSVGSQTIASEAFRCIAS